MGSKLSLAVVVVIALAAGVLAGLGISIVASPRLVDLEAECRGLRAERARLGKIEVEHKRLSKDLGETKAALEERKKAFLKEAEKARELDRMQREHLAWAMKSQAFIGAMITVPSARQALLSEEFASKFKSDWYAPMTALRLLGSKWIVDEMVQQGMVSEGAGGQQMKSIAAAQWKPIRSWNLEGIQATEPFVITTKVWRVRWEAADPSGWVAIYAKREGTDELAGIATGTGDGSSFIRRGPGRFYLEIHSIGCASQITAEEVP